MIKFFSFILIFVLLLTFAAFSQQHEIDILSTKDTTLLDFEEFLAWGNGEWHPRTGSYCTYYENGKLAIKHKEYYDLYYNRKIFRYNRKGNRTEIVEQSISTGKWENSRRRVFKYDDYNNIIEYLWQDSDEDGWKNSRQDLYLYNEKGILIEESWKFWSVGGELISYQKKFHSYDEYGNATGRLVIGLEDGVWTNLIKGTNYKYDELGNLIESTYQKWENDRWINDEKYIYDYNELGQIICSVMKIWFNDRWINEKKEDYKYNENGFKSVTIHIYGTLDEWYNYGKEEYLYDKNNNVILWHCSYWDYDRWENEFQYIYVYDDKNNKIEFRIQDWRYNQWINHSKKIYKYKKVTVNESKIKENYQMIQNHPNPFTDITTLLFYIHEFSNIKLEFYDCNGNRITTLFDGIKGPGIYHYDFDGTNLPAGVYFCRLQIGNKTEVKKLILLR